MSILSKVVGLISPGGGIDTETAHFAVMSPTTEPAGEHKILIRLFENGLSAYHLRRTHWSVAQHKKWLAGVPAEFRRRVVLHQQPQLVRACGLGGFHCGGTRRPNFSEKPPYPVSSRAEDYPTLLGAAKFCGQICLGPIFPPENHDVTVPHRTLSEFAAIVAYWRAHGGNGKVIAFGGINEKNVGLCRAAGFDGFVVVSSVWKTRDPVKAFKNLVKKW